MSQTKYEVREFGHGFIVVGPGGALMRDGGAGVYGEPIVWRDRARAAAKAEWMATGDTTLLSGGQRKQLRATIAGKHGILPEVARGLLN